MKHHHETKETHTFTDLEIKVTDSTSEQYVITEVTLKATNYHDNEGILIESNLKGYCCRADGNIDRRQQYASTLIVYDYVQRYRIISVLCQNHLPGSEFDEHFRKELSEAIESKEREKAEILKSVLEQKGKS